MEHADRRARHPDGLPPGGSGRPSGDGGPAPGPALAPSFDRALASLTESQRTAVDCPSPSVCVKASAGSGKTRVLTLRIANRLRNGSADADHTVVCTFTRRAAEELRQRLRSYGVTVAQPSTRAQGPGPGVRVGTVHQLALSLLRRHALDTGRTLPTIAEQPLTIVARVASDPEAARELMTEIGWAKARCVAPRDYEGAAAAAGRSTAVPRDRIAATFAAYQQRLHRAGILDLDDVLADATDLLGRNSVFSRAARWRYRHLSVDEFQDVNPAQFRFLDALRGDGNDLFVVGDPDQAIYGWNGADPQILARMPQLLPGTEVVHLSENHRSTPQIVAAAVAALGVEAQGTPRSTRSDGPVPVVTAYDDDHAEARGVAAAVLAGRDAGQDWSDHAVLARTNEQLAVVGAVLAAAGVPAAIAGAPGVAERTRPSPNDTAAVDLTTFHRAKGLEWRVVHAIGLSDGYVPIVHADGRASRAEERRLLYVALSRATDELRCSWARARGSTGDGAYARAPSPWLGAVAEVSRVGDPGEGDRPGTVDVTQRIAALRAALGA